MPSYTTALLKSEIERDEGLKLRMYRDTVGLWTIGIGRNIEQRGITREEALFLLNTDIDICEADLDRNAPWWRGLSDARQRALINLCFALGWPKLSGFDDMLGALETGDWDRAAKEALDSKWADQTDGKLDGKDGQRAERIAEMFREG